MDYTNIPKEKFTLTNVGEKLADKKLDTKPIGYFKDALIRFRKNKSSVVGAIIIFLLLLYALVVPFISNYDVSFRDGYYKLLLPKANGLDFLGWDGCKWQTEPQGGYDYYLSIGQELGESAVREVGEPVLDDATGQLFYRIYVDSYDKVGFIYADLSEQDYKKLQAYQDETGIQVMYPIPDTYKTDFVAVGSKANLWYELANEKTTSNGESKYHDENGNPIFKANYKTSKKQDYAGYTSLKLASDNGGENGDAWYCYAVKSQTGYKVRLLYKEYYYYNNGFYAKHLFGTNQHGQDILACLASGARLSFLLAISVAAINFVIGTCYGAVEGYYGGTPDLIMERVRDILGGVPFMVVATLFQLHLADRVGPIVCLIFAYILTGWLGIAGRVRTQFYRFKNSEYVLAARTLGASDKRLIFRHILPNSLGTIITGTVLIIPGVIFSESMLTYLGIVNLQTSGMTSIGTMLATGQPYLSSYPHILLFPALFISLLEICFNLFGNGLRDAFNPSLRGSE